MVLDEAISALCLYLEKGAYGIRMFEAQGRSSYALGREVALWAGKKFKTSIFFIVAAGSLCIGDELLNGITSHAGGGAQVYGCIAGAEPSFYPQGAQPFVFDENQTVSDGLCVLALDGEKISVEGISANGWRGIGTHKTITRSKGNILYSIDNIPALDIIERYLKIDGHPDLACEYGLLWEEEDGTQVMRSIVAVQEDKSIVYSGSIPTGARVRFGLPPGPEITDHLMSRKRFYGKVLGHREDDNRIVRFTSVPPEVNAYFQAFLKLSRQ
jgi:hypothetical protein